MVLTFLDNLHQALRAFALQIEQRQREAGVRWELCEEVKHARQYSARVAEPPSDIAR